MVDPKNHNKAVLAHFSKQAVQFMTLPAHSQKSTLDLLLSITGVNRNDNVLDIACGPGLVACAFAEVAGHVTGIDITPAMIEQAKKLQKEKGLENMSWQVGDVLPLPYADASFSMVITRYSFHHLIDQEAVLREMLRVCVPNGKVLVVDVCPAPEKVDAYNRLERLREPSHTRALTLQEFLVMAEKVGLEGVETTFYKLDVELETLLKASVAAPGDDEKIRKLLKADLGKDNIGLGAYLEGNKLHVAFPTLVLLGRKASQ